MVTVLKISVQEPERGGINRVVSVEFGPQSNWAMTQSTDESWALGKLEILKPIVRRFERSYPTSLKRLSLGVNQLLVLWTAIYLPGLPTLWQRTIFVCAVFALILSVNWLHGRYLPFAAIYLTRKPVGVLARVSPLALSWIIAATAGIVAAVLSVYLQGWLSLWLAR
jgi:hypothetical protein